MLICTVATYCNPLYGTYLVRMKSELAPRAATWRSDDTLRLIKSRGMQRLQHLESLLGIEATVNSTDSQGPRSASTVKVKTYEKFWFINSARLVMRVDTAEELSKLPSVAEVVPDEKVFISSGVIDEGGYSPDLKDLGVDILHKLGLTGKGVSVGVIDTGLVDHNEFKGKVVQYMDFSPSPSKKFVDTLGHGSHVSGLIVGGNYSGLQIGMVPDAKLVVAKVIEPISAEGSKQIIQARLETFASRVLSAMQWMIDPDGNAKTNDFPQIINNSWGFPTAAPRSRNFFENALSRWRELGIIPVFAAGNEGADGINTIAYPANSTQVITIGATRDGVRAPFSSIGSNQLKKPDFMTPGYRLFSIKKTWSGVNYGRLSGTSMAAPLISGLIAMLKQIDPFIEFSEIYRIFQNNSEDMGEQGWDFETGWGQVNFIEAVKEAEAFYESKVQYGGIDTFKYFRIFTEKYKTTRLSYYRNRLINLELNYMDFIENQMQNSSEVILDRWLNSLRREVDRDSQTFSALYERVNKRLKYLKIPH